MLLAIAAGLSLPAAPARSNIPWLDCKGTTWMNLHPYGNPHAVAPNLVRLA